MSYGQSKTDNEYARELVGIDAPKTVFMAICFSYAIRLGIEPGDAAEEIYREWQILHANGIVPQKPRRHKAKARS